METNGIRFLRTLLGALVENSVYECSTTVIRLEKYQKMAEKKETRITPFTKAEANAINKAVSSYSAVAHQQSRDFSNLAPRLSGKPGLTFEDYYHFRPDEAPGSSWQDVFRQADVVYQKVGLVWNVINLMADFTTKGIRIVHPNARIEAIYQDWWQRIGGPYVSERFANYTYRLSNVIIQRYTAKIKRPSEIAVASTQPDQVGLPMPFQPAKNVIPWKYVFINPAACEIVGGPLASFLPEPVYAIKLPEEVRNAILSPKSDIERLVLEQLPQEIKDAARERRPYILNKDRTIVYHFKKDDWKPWGLPITTPIYDDIIMLHKLKLADMCALDGASSKIRIFKVGNIEAKLAPTPEATALLSSLIENNVGGGTIDIIWGPDLELIETSTDSYNFLGEEKYKPTLNNIYQGLGIPPTLTANFGASGTTNNYISLKTLTERLEHGRNMLVDFWEREIAIFQKAMGFRSPAEIEFDGTILANEDTEKKLLLDLCDRNILSEEMVQRKFGMSPKMEKIRLNREQKQREAGTRVNKAGPWFNPQVDEELTKIALQSGVVTPSQVGLELERPPQSEIDTIHKLNPPKLATDQKKNSGQPGKGRPKMKKDSTKRKKKKFSPRSKAMIKMWANNAQGEISKALNPVILKFFNKKNMRSLTNEEFAMSERIKFNVLCGLEPLSEINKERLTAELETNRHFVAHAEALKEKHSDFLSVMGKEPTLEEIHQLQAEVYSELLEDAKAAVYGYCPKCGAEGVQRERGPNGNDMCANGCIYPSKDAIMK